MTTLTDHTPAHQPVQGWFSRSEAWLDNKGKGAWIAAMVLGFIFFWPVGLALLFYMIWSKKMFGRNHSCKQARFSSAALTIKSSGNTAFDAYKTDTLRRLEEEQGNFEAFLERLRAAKDKNEFDQFMDEQADKARSTDEDKDAA